ncbi:MAG: rod shape-determining protein MreC [Deltaproteobacteria bacterium]|nr:rod shape-determining protein MreC [Deltaproteobacteria bacterium]MCL4872853.1 rod shape-determining protein MreC [bacterium]
MRGSERNFYSFLKRHQLVLISAVLAVFSLHLALTDRKEYERGYLLKEALSYALTPVQETLLGAEAIAEGVWSDYVLLVGVNRENSELKNAVSVLEEENNRLREEIMRDARLRAVLGYRDALPFSTTGAAVTGFNVERWTRTIVVNKGLSDGIGKDHAVIAPQGIVGRTLDVHDGSSRVLLMTDARSNIDVIVQRTRVKGVAEGNGTDALVLKYVRVIDDVQVGDKVVTSGISGIFPKGLVVGEVTKIEKARDNFFNHIEVRPAVDIKRLEEVLVLSERPRMAE